MDKYIFDEGNGLWYELIGDYYFPCLTVPTEEEQPVGIWGQRHKRYIKEYHPALYNALLLNGRLNSYLADIDQQAQERLDTIIEQMARSQGITEALKAADQMTWVGKMNNIQASAMEIVNSELIYVILIQSLHDIQRLFRRISKPLIGFSLQLCQIIQKRCIRFFRCFFNLFHYRFLSIQLFHQSGHFLFIE